MEGKIVEIWGREVETNIVKNFRWNFLEPRDARLAGCHDDGNEWVI